MHFFLRQFICHEDLDTAKFSEPFIQIGKENNLYVMYGLYGFNCYWFLLVWISLADTLEISCFVCVNILSGKKEVVTYLSGFNTS